jgi:hypothetical protein
MCNNAIATGFNNAQYLLYDFYSIEHFSPVNERFNLKKIGVNLDFAPFDLVSERSVW